MCERREVEPSETKEAIVCFPVKDNKVLLGIKKKSFGEGYLVGAGGKVQKSEGVEECVQREIREELGITVTNLTKVGEIRFSYPDTFPFQEQTVHFFIAAEFVGEPIETEEIIPQWFDIDSVPYDRMLPTNGDYVPSMLKGAFVRGKISFTEEWEVLDKQITFGETESGLR